MKSGYAYLASAVAVVLSAVVLSGSMSSTDT